MKFPDFIPPASPQRQTRPCQTRGQAQVFTAASPGTIPGMPGQHGPGSGTCAPCALARLLGRRGLPASGSIGPEDIPRSFRQPGIWNCRRSLLSCLPRHDPYAVRRRRPRLRRTMALPVKVSRGPRLPVVRQACPFVGGMRGVSPEMDEAMPKKQSTAGKKARAAAREGKVHYRPPQAVAARHRPRRGAVRVRDGLASDVP